MGYSCRYCSRARFTNLPRGWNPKWPYIESCFQISDHAEAFTMASKFPGSGKCRFWNASFELVQDMFATDLDFLDFVMSCDLPGWETNFNIESTKHLSKHIGNFVNFGTHFESIWGAWAHLGQTLGSQRLRRAFQASIFKDFVSKRGPHWDPKITLGASRWPSELPRTSFGRDFLRTYILHEHRNPKLIQKVILFGTLGVAETW